MKLTGERSAGKPHAAFDVAGTGNVMMVAGLRALCESWGITTGALGARACSRPYLREPEGEVTSGYFYP